MRIEANVVRKKEEKEKILEKWSNVEAAEENSVARAACLRDDSVAQSADSQVSCKCTQNRCPTGSRGRARRDATSRSIDRAHRALVHACSCVHQRRAFSRHVARSQEQS